MGCCKQTRSAEDKTGERSTFWVIVEWFHKTKQMWEVEGSERAFRVTRTGRGSTFGRVWQGRIQIFRGLKLIQFLESSL